MMDEFGVEHVDLPLNEARLPLIGQDEDVVDGGDSIRISFDPEEQRKQAGRGANRAQIGTVEELRIAFVTYLRHHDPQKLDCMVKMYLKEGGHRILWTPPYCPELQPIELFWAAGKNHAALYFWEGQRMKQTIEL